MKGLFIFFTFTLSFFNVTLCSAAHAKIDTLLPLKILVLKSKDSSYYDKTINTIRKNFNDNVLFRIKNIKDQPQLNNEKLIISLGVKAAQHSRINFPEAHKIFAFITSKHSQQLELKQNETHLLIEQSPQQYIRFTQAILPDKKIGIMFQKNTYGSLSEEEENNILLFEINKKSNIIIATRNVIKTADVLLALPNKNIYNRLSLKGILLSTFQNETPLISYSPAHVKAGALAAIYASPLNLGQQIVEVINSFLSTHEIQNLRQYAKYFSIKTNKRVARSLALEIETEQKILSLLRKSKK